MGFLMVGLDLGRIVKDGIGCLFPIRSSSNHKDFIQLSNILGCFIGALVNHPSHLSCTQRDLFSSQDDGTSRPLGCETPTIMFPPSPPVLHTAFLHPLSPRNPLESSDER